MMMLVVSGKVIIVVLRLIVVRHRREADLMRKKRGFAKVRDLFRLNLSSTFSLIN